MKTESFDGRSVQYDPFGSGDPVLKAEAERMLGKLDLLQLHCRAFNLHIPVREHRFCTTRRWRIDYAWPDHKLAVEVDGGAFTQGRHTRGAGFVKDMEKQNALAIAGWRILRFTPQDVKKGVAVLKIQEYFKCQSSL